MYLFYDNKIRIYHYFYISIEVSIMKKMLEKMTFEDKRIWKKMKNLRYCS
jgi:hypothetical protein